MSHSNPNCSPARCITGLVEGHNRAGPYSTGTSLVSGGLRCSLKPAQKECRISQASTVCTIQMLGISFGTSKDLFHFEAQRLCFRPGGRLRQKCLRIVSVLEKTLEYDWNMMEIWWNMVDKWEVYPILLWRILSEFQIWFLFVHMDVSR